MRKSITLTVLVTAIFLGANAHAEPPANIDTSDRVTIEACVLSSEKPHISSHVPGTVNVTARTVCKGISAGRNLKITITLVRKDGGNTLPITKSITGVGSVVGNISMPCIWVRKQAEIEYIVTTVHRMSNGKSATTRNGATLKC
jgi:hypothetical protein